VEYEDGALRMGGEGRRTSRLAGGSCFLSEPSSHALARRRGLGSRRRGVVPTADDRGPTTVPRPIISASPGAASSGQSW
jgi:hypothetical protein